MCSQPSRGPDRKQMAHNGPKAPGESRFQQSQRRRRLRAGSLCVHFCSCLCCLVRSHPGFWLPHTGNSPRCWEDSPGHVEAARRQRVPHTCSTSLCTSGTKTLGVWSPSPAPLSRKPSYSQAPGTECPQGLLSKCQGGIRLVHPISSNGGQVAPPL